MNEALVTWLNKLSSQSLPALKINCELLGQIARDERCDMEKLAIVIESDPGLSVLLLRHINQLRQKNKRNEITTPRHALMMLGMEQFKKLLLQVTTSDDLTEGAQLRLHQLYSQAVHAAYQARALGELRRDMDTAELYSSALLHSIAEVMLSLHAPQEMQQVQKLINSKGQLPQEAQTAVLGFTFDQLGFELTKAWGLPSLLLESVRGEVEASSRANTIVLASQIARLSQQGWYQQALYQFIEGLAEQLTAEGHNIATLLHRTAVDAANGATAYRVPHPAALLLYPAQDPDTEQSVSTIQKSPRAAEAESASGAYCLMPQRLLLARALKKLHSTTQQLAYDEVIQLCLEGMHKGLALNRVVFCEFQTKGQQLRASQAVNSHQYPELQRITIDTAKDNLFSRLMEKQQAFWLDDDNRAKFFSFVPVNFHKLINNDSFFVMSLLVNGAPAGMFFADRESRQCRLDAESYKRFKQLITLARHHLERG